MSMLMVVVAALAIGARAQAPANLVANGGFEMGWAAWTGRTERSVLVTKPVRTPGRALRLDAVGLSREVSVHSAQFPVVGGHAYHLAAMVRHAGGKPGYKVTIDWQDTASKHIAYANDWRGSDKPAAYAIHGGVFAAPVNAARALLILGVQPGAAYLFDELSMNDLGVAEPLDARPRTDGDGTFTVEGSATAPARGHATWRVRYRAGQSGVPVGGAVVLRRWPVSHEWSRPQGSDPRGEGYVSVSGRPGAMIGVETDQIRSVVLRVHWPPLQPGETLDFVIGDRSRGGPGMRVQGKTGPVRWIGASDCTADGEYADCKGAPMQFAVVPGPATGLRVSMPAVGDVSRASPVTTEAVDSAGNVAAGFSGSVTVRENDRLGRSRALAVRFGATHRGRRTLAWRWSAQGEHRVTVSARMGARTVKAEDWTVVTAAPVALPVPEDDKPYARVSKTQAVVGTAAMALAMSSVHGCWGSAQVYTRKPNGAWVRVASLPAVARAAPVGWFDRPVPGMLLFGDRIRATQTAGKASLVVAGTMIYGPEWEAPFEATYEAIRGAPSVQFSFKLTSTGSMSFCSIHAPILYAGDGTGGDRKRESVFPGLEYLTADEMSSDDKGVAWDVRERWVAHPYKITVPAMAVASDAGTVALLWDPLQRWHGQRQVPLAHFASPNRRERKLNHLMALAAPAPSPVPREGLSYVENVAGSRSGYTLRNGEQLRLSATIMATSDPGDVGRVALWWRELVRAADHPPAIRSREDGLELSAQGYLKTAWDPGTRAWVQSIGWKPVWAPTIAARMLTTADLLPGRPIAEQCRAQVADALSQAGSPSGITLLMRMGLADHALAALRAQARGAMATQRPDGTWRFRDVYSMQGIRAGLADAEDSEIGTCVNMLDGLLAYAVATRDREATRAGLRGLEAIRRFTKPCGSESWEVPLTCPNLRAAALAARCWLRGWQLTGDPSHLDLARDWALKGAAFIYCWQAPNRPVMPGASISVMGTTFYEQGWFGWPVQWVGLVYAEAIMELARHDPAYDWRGLADLIVSSAMRQQKTQAVTCHHGGFIPDAYSVLTGTDAYEWCIGPVGVTAVLTELLGYVADPVPVVIEAGDARVHLFGAVTVVSAAWDAALSRLTLRLRYPPATAGAITLHGIAEPSEMIWDGRSVERSPSRPDERERLRPGRARWWRPASTRAIALDLSWTAPEHDLVITGCRPMLRTADDAAEPVVRAIVNGGFEDDLVAWRVDPSGRLDGQRPHSGANALLLASMQTNGESQAESEPFAVAEGRRYRLTASVWQVQGDGDYKVTVEWLDSTGSHLRFDNDWTGTNRPGAYATHSASVTAPPRAALARIILGCRRAVCLFDDVILEEAK